MESTLSLSTVCGFKGHINAKYDSILIFKRTLEIIVNFTPAISFNYIVLMICTISIKNFNRFLSI